MEDQHLKQSGGTSTNNQGTKERTGNPGDQQQYKNVETSVNSPESFDDDFEVQQEDEINSGEGKSEQGTPQNEPR